jgi:hypothetical protein
MSEQRASERITEEVTSWPGVVAGPGSRGEFSFKVGSREIGHLHGDHAAHFGFRRRSGKSCSTRSESTTTQCSQAGRASARE